MENTPSLTTATHEQQQHLKVNNNTLTKTEQDALLRSVLPSINGQEGSPCNTFTPSELKDLQEAVGSITVGASRKTNRQHTRRNTLDIRDLQASFNYHRQSTPQGDESCPQEAGGHGVGFHNTPALDWHGAPRLHKDHHLSRQFREQQVRPGHFTAPTNGVCPGFLQCNLVVLPQGPIAFDFLLFCQRNPKACPLIEVCDVGSPFPHGVAPGADLRTDVPKCVCESVCQKRLFAAKVLFSDLNSSLILMFCYRYAIYRNGQLEKEVTNATDYWPEHSVAFLIGCSFSYDGALMDAGIPLKSAEQGLNVPMYKTTLKCRSAGSLGGNMVVSMKPIPSVQISKHVEITSKYSHAHGGPVAVGSASALGITDISCPEWGEPIEISHDEVPVFHACGVTPQSILMDSKVPFAITHSAGHMFVTDLPSDMGV